MDSSDDELYDAADALFQRGACLRKLREMEREDEAQRELQATHSQQDDDTLLYETYLSSQSYYDDYKHVNYNFIDFGIVGDRPLIIGQDRTVGKGGFVWDAGFVLAEHVVNEKEWQTEKPASIIELGAGTGITGLVVATACPNHHVHLTDLPQLIPLLKENSKEIINSSVDELEWGRSVSEKYDVILGADVVASIYDSFGLAKTVYDLAHDESRVYLACRDRLAGSIEKFEIYMKEMFAHVERRKAQSANKNPDVWILFAHGRRNEQ